MSITIPLFPLKTVLFPGGVLPLRIFEPRYLDMVSDCLKQEKGIGVIQIKNGTETGQAAEVYETGTLSQITYWHKRSDGLLGITLKGEQRFRILSQQIQPNQLIMADIELLPNIEQVPHDLENGKLAGILQKIMTQMGPPFSTVEKHFDDAEWVSARLVELLPLELSIKQEMLDSDDIQQRLSRLEKLLKLIG